jgi:hypothetical protein
LISAGTLYRFNHEAVVIFYLATHRGHALTALWCAARAVQFSLGDTV